jgi:hypothetical protein
MTTPRDKPRTAIPAGQVVYVDVRKRERVKVLGERIAAAREQLGALDFDKAVLEARAQQVRAQLQRELAESNDAVVELAKAEGVAEPATFDWKADKWINPVRIAPPGGGKP